MKREVLRILPDALIADGQRHEGWGLIVAEGRIQALGPAESLDSELPTRRHAGATLTPGLIDLQFNGAFGHHLSDEPEALWTCAAGLPRYGVSRFLPTLITSPPQATDRALAVLADGPPAGHRGAAIPGFHFEGPYLHPDRVGAHDPRFLRRPEIAEIRHWRRDQGLALVTLAPELPGALAMIEALVAADVVVSAGHSTADFDEARAGFDAGVRYLTHLFNAMPGIHHRAPGLAAAALADERVRIGIIPDGIHVHPELVALVHRLVGAQRLSPVTDAMSAMGMPPGEYAMGAFRIRVDATSARQEDGTLAGSILTLDRALRNLMSFGNCRLEDVLPSFTEVPADLLGLETGRLRPGLWADFTLFDEDLEVLATYVEGELVYALPSETST
jgi:N-acetylglucosamine-6-phosphate deacetylase